MAKERKENVTKDDIEGALAKLSNPYPFLRMRSDETRIVEIDVQHEALIRNWEMFKQELRQEGYATRALEEVTRSYATRTFLRPWDMLRYKDWVRSCMTPPATPGAARGRMPR